MSKSKDKDVILVVVDRLTKYAHFLPMDHPYIVHKVATLFIDNILKLHGPQVVIVTDRDGIFTSKLWQEIFNSLKISLHFSTAYHPETDGQTERVNQCVEQYLWCMLSLNLTNGVTGCRLLNGGTTVVTTHQSNVAF
jgi:IS30 family transposase